MIKNIIFKSWLNLGRIILTMHFLVAVIAIVTVLVGSSIQVLNNVIGLAEYIFGNLAFIIICPLFMVAPILAWSKWITGAKVSEGKLICITLLWRKRKIDKIRIIWNKNIFWCKFKIYKCHTKNHEYIMVLLGPENYVNPIMNIIENG